MTRSTDGHRSHMHPTPAASAASSESIRWRLYVPMPVPMHGQDWRGSRRESSEAGRHRHGTRSLKHHGERGVGEELRKRDKINRRGRGTAPKRGGLTNEHPTRQRREVSTLRRRPGEIALAPCPCSLFALVGSSSPATFDRSFSFAILLCSLWTLLSSPLAWLGASLRFAGAPRRNRGNTAIEHEQRERAEGRRGTGDERDSDQQLPSHTAKTPMRSFLVKEVNFCSHEK